MKKTKTNSNAVKSISKKDSPSETSLKKPDYDLIVIGSGPAGIHASIQSAKLGAKTCMIEKNPEQMGGAWIHTGTLPSKTFRESLAAVQSIKHHVGSEWVNRVNQDLQLKVFDRAKMVSAQEESVVKKYLEKNKVDVIGGYGYLENEHSVRVTPVGEETFVLNAKKILIATGSRPRRPENIPFDGWRVVDSDEILSLEEIPKSLIIYGAGVIGCEYACIFAALGVDVTLVDARERMMQYMDYELTKELEKALAELGVKIVLGKTLERIECEGPQAIFHANEYSVKADMIFFAAGRVSNTEHLGLSKLGIKTSDRGGAVIVNKDFQTNISSIYAAGDVIGYPALASTSMLQGRHVACHAQGARNQKFPEHFPVGVYTIPEMSMIGKTEEECISEGIDYVVGRANYSEIARAYIGGEYNGLLKIILDRCTQKIIGIHIVGTDACNLIHIGLAFMMKDGRAQDFIHMVFNHPTLAEGYKIAGFNALNKIFKDGNIMDPCEETEKHLRKIANENVA